MRLIGCLCDAANASDSETAEHVMDCICLAVELHLMEEAKRNEPD